MPEAIDRYDKKTHKKEDVEAEGQMRVDIGGAESYSVKEDADNWILVTVVK